MSAFRALDAARAAGVDVRLDGINLAVSAASEPPIDVIDLLRRYKLSIVAVLQPIQPWDATDWRAYFDERAAVAEFDHGLPRPEAEARAFEFCVSEWLRQHAVYSVSDRCLRCGDADRRDHPLLPIGIAGAGQAWLHIECSATWSAVRKVEAVAAMGAMGIVAAPCTRSTQEKATSGPAPSPESTFEPAEADP